MKRSLLAAGLALSASLWLAAAPARGARALDDGLPSVRPVGLMINGPTGAGTGEHDDQAFFGAVERTRVALLLRFPAGGVVDLVQEESSLDLLRDDRGTDLLGEPSAFGPFEVQARVSPRRDALVFYASSDELPASRARRLEVGGTVAVRVARETRRDEAPVTLAKGATVQVGEFPFRVKEVGPSPWGNGWSIQLVTRRDPSTIVAWSFRDGGGREHELSLAMTMSGNGVWQLELSAAEELTDGTLVVEAWADPGIARVPFRLGVGLGL